MGLNDMTIYLTEECNFRCTYCYYKKDYESTLDSHHIKSWINLYLEEIADREKQIYITILGGEPLMKRELLFSIIDLITQKRIEDKLNLKIILFTNGSLITCEDIEYFIKKNVQICISFDGIKESNDFYRKFRDSDNSTFDVIVNRLKNFPKEYMEKMGVNMVVGPDNCRYLMENIYLFQSLNFKSIDINLMSYVVWSKESLNLLTEQLNKLYKYYISLFFEDSDKARPFIMYQLNQLFNKSGWGHMDDCNRIKIGPDGGIYFCDSFFSFSKEIREKYGLKMEDKSKFLVSLENLKKEARENLEHLFPKTFLMHKQNKLMYCPYGVYYYSKLKNEDLEKSLKNFYLFSIIFSSFLKNLFDKLKDNPNFIKLYKDGQ